MWSVWMSVAAELLRLLWLSPSRLALASSGVALGLLTGKLPSALDSLLKLALARGQFLPMKPVRRGRTSRARF
jgi:hypothetical protein